MRTMIFAIAALALSGAAQAGDWRLYTQGGKGGKWVEHPPEMLRRDPTPWPSSGAGVCGAGLGMSYAVRAVNKVTGETKQAYCDEAHSALQDENEARARKEREREGPKDRSQEGTIKLW